MSGCGGLNLEHKLRVAGDCPDVEKVSEVLYHLDSGGILPCKVMRVVTGPPYVNAQFLDCQPPLYRDPPSERRAR